MTARFVIPASTRLVSLTAEARAAVPHDLGRAKKVFVEVGNQYVDDVVDGLVLAFVAESGGTSDRTRGLVQTLAGLIKSVSHALVGQAFGKLDAAGSQAMVGFMDERLVPFRDGMGLGVPIEPSIAAGIEACNRLADAGQVSADRHTLEHTLVGVIERALDGHYKKPFALLDLGFLVRKGVDVGYDAIRKGALSTVRTAVEDGDERTLAELARFLGARYVR